MPIKGLTDRGAPTFPKIGDIRKGAPKKKNGQVGPDLKHFRYVPVGGEEEAAGIFLQVYGKEPREINVFLPFDEIDRNFEAFMERHTASALQCRGDGETAFMWRDKGGKIQKTPKKCPTPACEGCKETGRLKVIIPELRRLAYVVVHTTSIWDILELTANLEALRKLTGNGLKGIPLVLKRRPREISTPRKGSNKRFRQEKWLLSIEADQRWVAAQLRAMEAAALPGGAMLLPEPEAEIEKGQECPDCGAYIETGKTVCPDCGVDIGTDEIIEAEWNDEAFEAGEDKPAEPEPAPLDMAMAYKTDSGKKLGSLGPGELMEMLDKINGLEDPSAKMRKIKTHIEVLLEHLAQFEATASEEAQKELPL